VALACCASVAASTRAPSSPSSRPSHDAPYGSLAQPAHRLERDDRLRDDHLGDGRLRDDHVVVLRGPTWGAYIEGGEQVLRSSPFGASTAGAQSGQ
jgi:hypothetical protein